ncbi:hypothetical protein MHYP_G00306930 [Metynnis hypsauchen]
MVITGAVETDQASEAVRSAEEEKHDKVEQIHEEIQKVKEQREAVAEFPKKVRRAVHVRSRKTKVAEIQTRRFILQESVMKVMEDLMKTAGESAEGISKLIDAMKENNRKLAAVCNSPNNAEDEGY